MVELKAYINGDFISTQEWVEIISPIDLKPYGRVPALKAQEIDLAFHSARVSQKKWEHESLTTRINYIKKWAQLMYDHRSEIAELMAHEIGKNLKDSENEVIRTVEYIDYTIEEVRHLELKAFSGDSWNANNKLGIFSRIAKGVILAISPFNYPINLSIAKIAPSLLTGNSVVFKPATNGSLVGLTLAKLADEAKIPAGVFNVVTGKGSEIGDLIITNSESNLISFTGSVPVGNHIKKISQGKELVLELGGKDPALVLDDANLEKATKEIIGGAFSYSGQRCTAIKRVLVDEKVADNLVELLTKEIKNISEGSPLENKTVVPLIDNKAADFVESLLNDAVKLKAKVLIGGKRVNNLFSPTLVDYVTEDMQLAWEEPFGPILPVIRCKNVDEMIRISNKSEFGLQASIFTENLNNAFNIAHSLDVGTVNINGKSQRGPDSFPFLGIKNSGQGVQGIGETISSVTRIKGLVINY